MSEADLSTLLTDAERHYNAGRREEARAIYSEVLSRDPKQPIALHALGWLAHEAGESRVRRAGFRKTAGGECLPAARVDRDRGPAGRRQETRGGEVGRAAERPLGSPTRAV